MVFGGLEQPRTSVEASASTHVDHAQEYHVRDLSTRSLTIYPSRTQVVRELKGVALKPGTNQLTILGLTPTLDEHSIKVESNSSAIVTDISVESLPNRDSFEDEYPDSDSHDGGHDKEDADEEKPGSAGEDEENPVLVKVRKELLALRSEHKRAVEMSANAKNRQNILDTFLKTLTTNENLQDHVRIEDALETYRSERARAFEDHLQGEIKKHEIDVGVAAKVKEEERLLKQMAKEAAKSKQAEYKAGLTKRKEMAKQQRQREERAKEKNRIRIERESFWPKMVYAVKVNLEAAAAFTPASSPRASVTSDTVEMMPEPSAPDVQDDATPITCDLSLSYVTAYAFWSPSYDLALSTTGSASVLCFDARLTNQTSETWSSCKVTLSTSQTESSSLGDPIPTLTPWHIRLADEKNGSDGDKHTMYSAQEHVSKFWATQRAKQPVQNRPRHMLFGVDRSGFGQPVTGLDDQMQATSERPRGVRADDGLGNCLYSSVANFGSLYDGAGQGGLFGGRRSSRAAHSNPPGPSTFAGSLFGGASSGTRGFGNVPGSFGVGEGGGGGGSLFGHVAKKTAKKTPASPSSPSSPDDFSLSEDSLFEETGLTATFELPGLRTLAPSSTASKQHIARAALPSVTFSHTVLAKLKPAAYLQAKVRNGKKLALIKGPAGLTLDGAFLGRTSLPSCHPGGEFTLSLGIDPSIEVAYPRPEVKRSQQGLFSREGSAAYSRSVALTNKRSGYKNKPAQITVVDQVPVSEDERLRVVVLEPYGLTGEGAAAPTGQAGSDSKGGVNWGKAEAVLKKGGEVSWDVTLNAGCQVQLNLEYQCGFPAGEHVINANT
ncbi:hypothetical protein F4780DRAFT_733053 [Xylariomycetidae sp. FL0641]|nr:hypothetical protein F4780DRAFT_733053 [Xylariomycetidae sp. FL0641]